jgi:hypothetical protein
MRTSGKQATTSQRQEVVKDIEAIKDRMKNLMESEVEIFERRLP